MGKNQIPGLHSMEIHEAQITRNLVKVYLIPLFQGGYIITTFTGQSFSCIHSGNRMKTGMAGNGSNSLFVLKTCREQWQRLRY